MNFYPIPTGPLGNKNFLASLNPANSETFQRIDIGTHSLGPPALEPLKNVMKPLGELEEVKK